MADRKTELRADIVGNDRLSAGYTAAGRSVKDLSGKMDIAAKSAKVLDDALDRQRIASRVSVDATLALAKADDILADAEHTLRDGALEAEFALKKETEAKKKSGDAALAAAAKNEAFRKSLNKATSAMKDKGGPAWLGPALLAAPVAASVAGVGAGAAIGLGGAFATSAVALAAYGVVAKSVLSQASTATKAVQTAQENYNIAIANGTKKATAYKAEQIAIAKAYAGMSPAQIQLSKELGQISDQWSRFKQAVTPMIAGSLQPWLHGVGVALQSLRSLITPMAPVVHDLGVQFATLTTSSTFRTFAAWVGTTGAKVTRSAGNAVMDLLTGMTFLLPQFTPLIKGAADGISKWGDAFVRWSASQKAADEIHSFLEWFHQNGPAVGTLVKNVGLALKALAPGLGPASVTELHLVSNFFAFVAKLPPGLAKPLVETAGALLLLNKVGVVSVGIKVVGLAGLTGTTGAIAAGGAGIAAGLILRVREDLKSGLKGIVHDIPLFLSGLPGILTASASGWTSIFDQKFNKPVAAKERQFAHDIAHIFDGVRHNVTKIWNTTWNNTVARLQRGLNDSDHYLGIWQHDTAHWFDLARHAMASSWDTAWSNTVSRAVRGDRAAVREVNIFEHNVAHWFDVARHAMASIWDSAWNNTVGAAIRGVSNVLRWVGSLPGGISGKFRGAGSLLLQAGQKIISGLLRGAQTIWRGVAGWFGGLPGQILHALGIHSPPQWALDAGKHIMGGILKGLAHNASDVPAFFRGLASNILGPLKGVWKSITGFFSGGGSGPVQALAQQMARARGWTGFQWNALNSVEMAEAGWNLRAVNPSSGAYGIAQFINGPSEYAQYGGNASTAAGQITGFLNYIAQRYGSPAAAWAHEQAYHWYAGGTLSAAPGWGWVGERGPELMHFRGGEQVIPNHAIAAAGGNTYIIKVAPTPLARPADIGREVVGAIRAHEKQSGKGWRS